VSQSAFFLNFNFQQQLSASVVGGRSLNPPTTQSGETLAVILENINDEL
jgi:hypothetical protein